MPTPNHNAVKQGVLYVLICYLIWGLFPVYWYPLNHAPIDAGQILAWRVLWSAVFASLVLFARKEGGLLWQAAKQPRVLCMFALSGIMIGLNWLVFLWAMTNDHVLDASLGYFISPLFSILLGRLVFKEALNKAQLLAIVFACVGILWLAIPAGQVPWVALLLTLSFGFYGLLHKVVPFPALAGLVLETWMILPFSLLYLGYCQLHGHLVFSQLAPLPLAVLIGSGVVTTIPLLLFSAAARRIPLSLVGMIQYLSPSMQMVAGLLLFDEVFNTNRFIGYMWVWLGVATYVFGLWQQRQAAK